MMHEFVECLVNPIVPFVSIPLMFVIKEPFVSLTT